MNTRKNTPPNLPLCGRPPAVPLIVHDPYFSVWSFTDRLTDSCTRHWTGARHGLCGLARIDGQTWRFAGDDNNIPALVQTALEVLPTRTIYHFEAQGIDLTVTFMTPALPDDLDVLARPTTYVTFAVRSRDRRPHRVQIYFDMTGEWSVDTPDQKVSASRFRLNGVSALRIGAHEQRLLERAGDNLRIEWGHLYLAVPAQPGATDVLAGAREARAAFARTGQLPAQDDLREPCAAQDGWPVLAAAFDLTVVRPGRTVSRHVIVAYDDYFAVEYLQRRLRPYWRRHGLHADGLLCAAARDYAALVRRCREFDTGLMADLRAAGGLAYARLCALSYRQALGAHKLAADWDGTLLFLSKENFSNGCIATVDVTYPSAPLFLALNAALLWGMIEPVLQYAASPRWKFPFAPHDLGTYPLANGQVYGGGEQTEENQMPVEECGNLLILVAAYVHYSKQTDDAEKYWPLLHQWADYLLKYGRDPGNQLCTDDFAGHLAHNTNLSLKAILAIGSFAALAKKLGKPAVAKKYRTAAEKMATYWQRQADDGDHYRLTFDKPGTWSQKYNLVWDQLLGLKLFPAAVARKEIAFYKKMQNTYGLPLDCRTTYTKLDWTVWSATLATTAEDFATLTNPLYRWLNETPTRVPLTDWFWTTDAGAQVGFQARSVVGGLFIKLLKEQSS